MSCSGIVLTFLNLFMTIILNSLLGKSLISVSLRSVSEFCQFFSLEYVPLFYFFESLFDLCALDKRAISPSLDRLFHIGGKVSLIL